MVGLIGRVQLTPTEGAYRADTGFLLLATGYGQHSCLASWELCGHFHRANSNSEPSLPLLQVVQLLGKLGGRNRRFLKKPTELDYKDNPEHGLRLILTFHPSTSFLVPLDRCIAMTRRAVAEGDKSESLPCTAQHMVS